MIVNMCQMHLFVGMGSFILQWRGYFYRHEAEGIPAFLSPREAVLTLNGLSRKRIRKLGVATCDLFKILSLFHPSFRLLVIIYGLVCGGMCFL